MPASMGPRPRGRGDRYRHTAAPTTPCFNGAAPKRTRRLVEFKQPGEVPTPLQWGRAQEDAETTSTAETDITIFKLQWGRAQEDAETGRAGGVLQIPELASMGPRPRGRGDPIPRRRPGAGISFNGAAPKRTRRPLEVLAVWSMARSLQWGRAQEDAETGYVNRPGGPVHQASMGPRPRGRGDSRSSVTTAGFAWLQWGRAQEDAETFTSGSATACPWRRFNGAAPKRTRRRGDGIRPAPRNPSFNGAAPKRTRRHAEVLDQRRAALLASMGPRPRGRGD